MDTQSIPERIDVLIVGMGPVGAGLASLLGRQGTRTLVVERATEIFAAPRAIALDNEALRILQQCGLQEGELDTVAIPEVTMRSPMFGVYGRAVTVGACDGHPRLVTFYQPQLETILRRRVAALPSVTVRLGVELLDFEATAAGVSATLRDAAGAEKRVHARFLVGADGAGSPVRNHLGLGFEGRTYTEDWLVVDAKAVARPTDRVEFHCDHRRPSPHMVAPGGRQRWEFKLQPGETREQMEQPETVRRLLNPWCGEHPPEIERVAVYRFHARVVDHFRAGPVFLVGDAAHITPPFVGQGLVAGLRDASNLAWKLAWVVRGNADARVLDSYDAERRPHVRSMIALARFMGGLVMPRNALVALLTHGLMKLVLCVPRLRRLFEDLEIKPALRYARGCFVPPGRTKQLRAGAVFPQAWLREHGSGAVRLGDDILGEGFAIVGFGLDPTTDAPDHVVQAWRRAGTRFVQVQPRGLAAGATRADVVAEDLSGRFFPAAVPMGWVAIVRPDRIVLHEGPVAHASDVLADGLALISSGAQPAALLPRSTTNPIA